MIPLTLLHLGISNNIILCINANRMESKIKSLNWITFTDSKTSDILKIKKSDNLLSLI